MKRLYLTDIVHYFLSDFFGKVLPISDFFLPLVSTKIRFVDYYWRAHLSTFRFLTETKQKITRPRKISRNNLCFFQENTVKKIQSLNNKLCAIINNLHSNKYSIFSYSNRQRILKFVEHNPNEVFVNMTYRTSNESTEYINLITAVSLTQCCVS